MPNRIRQLLGGIWRWIEHIHTVVWILELLGLAGVIAGIVAISTHYFKSHIDWIIIGAIFVVSFLLMFIAPLLVSRRRSPATSPPPADVPDAVVPPDVTIPANDLGDVITPTALASIPAHQ